MNVFLECKPDQALAETLGVEKRFIVHSNDRAGVMRKLSHTTQSTGIIDEDPNSAQPGLLKELYNRYNPQNIHGIRVIEDSDRSNRIIIICPKLEDWIIAVSKKKKVDMATYSLSDRPNDLHDVINFRLDRFKQLVTFLINEKSDAVIYLKRLLVKSNP